MPGHGSIWWNELCTHDPERASAFYAKLLGWDYDAMPMAPGGTYLIAKVNGVPVAGIFPMIGDFFKDVGEHWLTYIEVSDVDAAIKATPAAGGQVLRDPFDVPGIGRIGMIRDANGAGLGFGTPAKPQT